MGRKKGSTTKVEEPVEERVPPPEPVRVEQEDVADDQVESENGQEDEDWSTPLRREVMVEEEPKGPYDNVENRSGAIRAIYDDLRKKGAADPSVGDVYEVFKTTKWARLDEPDKDKAQVSTTLSNYRKKLRGDTPGEKKVAFSYAEPTLKDLLRVKDLAEEEGGVQELVEMVQKVDDLAQLVGGISSLRKCLEALALLTK